MASRCVLGLILGCILFVLQPNTQTLASPLSIGNFNVSKAVDKVGKVLNGAKHLLGFGSGTTTLNPPTTTRSPLYVVIIPKGFSKKVRNASDNETTIREPTPPTPTKSSNRFIEGAKSLVNKAKSYWTKTTTSPPPKNVWLVPADWSKLTATRPPCHKEKTGSDQGCLSPSQLAGFSWLTLSLSLAGALLMGVGALVVFRRRWPGSSTTPQDSVKVRPPKLSWPWYPSDANPTTPRCPEPLPPPPVKMTIGPPVKTTVAVGMTAGPPPAWPAPPVPVHASERANSLYQSTPAASGHVYATPAPVPFSAWRSGASEHVHIYEIPPCLPGFDWADQEIDTTAMKTAAFSPKQAKC